MVSTDPIADMLTRIRNAINVRKTEVVMPYSIVKHAIASELVSTGFLVAANLKKSGQFDELQILINRDDENARITEIKRLSTPGRRRYVSSSEIPVIKRGRGAVILSTSKGVMNGFKASEQKLGGELIASVY
jgi:small subunit ribosomal protein S8